MSKSNHILIFPYPAQGHMLPMLDLAHKLSLNGLKLTILVTPKNLPALNPLLSSHPNLIQTLVLPFPNYPSLPSGVENVKEIGNKGNLPIINALGRLHGPIIRWAKAHPTPPVAIISDFFLGWTLNLATELKIPRVAFYSSGAFLTAVTNSVWKNIKEVLALSAVNFHDLPRSPSFVKEHLPSICRAYKESDPEREFLKNGMVANMSSWGCVFNTFDALEAEYLGHLRKTLGHSRIWGVGPLSLTNELTGRVDPDKVLGDDLTGWLDNCPDGSVLYVCFGSQKMLKRDQMEALADGLEKSHARFIWVVSALTAQQNGSGYRFLPDGFEERVSGRGLVIKGWAPQVSILNHRSVGGFLSHSGWNSVLEGISAGVMILAWPMEADQFVNARLLVEEMDVAVRVCEGADSVPDSSDLASTIAHSMNDVTPQKLRAKELRKIASEAVGKDGSSWVGLDDLAKELAQI